MENIRSNYVKLFCALNITELLFVFWCIDIYPMSSRSMIFFEAEELKQQGLKDAANTLKRPTKGIFCPTRQC